MNKQVKNIMGEQFGDLLVKGFAGSKNGKAYWFCDCSCGKKNHLVCGKNLRLGQVKRCRDGIHMKGRNKAEKHGEWKGDKATYSSQHAWVRRNLPKPEVCKDCGNRPPHDVANISQEYKRELSDYEWLCRKCHMTKDGRIEKYSFKPAQTPTGTITSEWDV